LELKQALYSLCERVFDDEVTPPPLLISNQRIDSSAKETSPHSPIPALYDDVNDVSKSTRFKNTHTWSDKYPV
jgi:hypothetical protein